jgi:hypothetical protein
MNVIGQQYENRKSQFFNCDSVQVLTATKLLHSDSISRRETGIFAAVQHAPRLGTCSFCRDFFFHHGEGGNRKSGF